VSCYIRHLKGLMEEIPLSETKENKKRLDLAIREILGYSSKEDCPLVWQELKRWLADQSLKAELMIKLRKKLEG